MSTLYKEYKVKVGRIFIKISQVGHHITWEPWTERLKWNRLVTYISSRWRIINSTIVEFVTRVFHNLVTVEHVQDAVETASVPVVCHTAAIVTFSSQIAQGIILNFLERMI
jgi:hypothetical protein